MRRSSKRRGDQEHFARIPVSVMESEAVKTLNHAAFKVLAILASQWRGKNNGSLALTEMYARRFGLRGRDTLYRSLRELENRGLIVCTRRGMKNKKLFSLFALGWESITHRDGRPLDAPEPKNHSRWLNWRAPAPPATTATAEIHTDDRERTGPIAGNDAAVFVPIPRPGLPVSVPAVGNTSRDLEGAPSVSDSPDLLRAPIDHSVDTAKPASMLQLTD